MTKQHTVLLLLLFSTATTLLAQRNLHRTNSLEAGILLGITNYSGDVAEKRVELNETHPGYGFFVRYNFNQHIGVKMHAYSGAISGDDRNTARAARSFKFGTSIFETALVGEWTLLPLRPYSNTGLHRFRVAPYLFGGLGYTFAEPRAEYYGPADQRNEVLVVPLPEEGLKTRFLIPMAGGGLRAEITERIVIGGEMGIRPALSDDLDGMKLNGNPKSKDWYYFTGVTISFILADQRR